MLTKNPHITIDEVKTNLEVRDYIDSHREFSPLKKADDAIVLDNSNLSMKDQLKIALKLVKERLETSKV
jgi:cytidylate kinase